MGSVEPREVHKANVEALIRTWADEKGIDIYVDQLLKLLDEDFLQSFPAIRNIPLPRKSERVPGGKIPNVNGGTAFIMVWTYGDPRYWTDELHSAIKTLWPDDQPFKPEKRSAEPSKNTQSSTDQPSSSVHRCVDGVADSQNATCEVTARHCCCRVVCSVQAIGDNSVRKRRKLPSWILAVSIDKAENLSHRKSASDSEDSAEASGFAYRRENRMEDLEERRKQQRNLQQRKRRYDNAVNPLRAELLAMRKEAENAAEEIRRKALEEAESIRSSARLLTEALSCGPSSLTLSREVPHTVPVGNAVSVALELLRFAQECAVETRAEATKVLMDARAEAEQIVCSARSNAAAITSSSNASVPDELKRFRKRNAMRKRERYWEIRGRDASKDSASDPVQSRSSSRDRGDRTIRRFVIELVDTFEQSTQKFSLKSKQLVCEHFWIHRRMRRLQPASLGCSKLDLSVATSIKDMRSTLQRVKRCQRNDYISAKHNMILGLASSTVVRKRYQSSLARALGVRRDSIFKAARQRAVLDSDRTQRFPTGGRKTRSDKFSEEIVTLVEEFWTTKSRVSPRKNDEVRKRIGRKVYESHQVHWIEKTEVWTGVA
ncbi:hypothetical protein R1sor_019883 [Riccia sorocarpa]|uniref:Uncharacterized protein n=1 Tax=Riccia sorocarpa TaxID=122646 RepID=A0ABD3IHZ8_9MARC